MLSSRVRTLGSSRSSIIRIAGPSLAFVLTLFAFLGIASAQDHDPSSGVWSGVIVSTRCNIDEAFAESEKCATLGSDGKVALYDDNIRQLYSLAPQDQATGH